MLELLKIETNPGPRRIAAAAPNKEHHMDPLLVEYGLFGGGLVPMKRPEDIARYNEALVDLGIAPTALTSINIDGIGWSPEVAVEQGNKRYMDHGDANQTAIIATPDQEKKPIHVLSHSYQRRLMRNFFARSRREIADVTTSACVRLCMDQATTAYESPKDLLYLETVKVQASAGKLTEEAHTQQTMADTFLQGNNWFDASLRAYIRESGQQHGNLLRRHVEIPDFLFALIGNFWSRAFGGVYVLLAGKDKILVVEDETLLPSLQPAKGERFTAFSVSQRKELIEHLIDEDLIELDNNHYKHNAADLEKLKNFIIADQVGCIEPDCDIETLSASRRKGILMSGKSNLPSVLPQLERYARNLSGQTNLKSMQHISDELQLLLLRPSEQAGENAQNILWMLLLRLQENPFDVLSLYQYDKERFFSLFETWSPAKKRWAAKYISKNYVPEMNQ